MSNPPVSLANVAAFYSPQDLVNWPSNLPPLPDQIKNTYLPLSGVQPMWGESVGDGEFSPSAYQQPQALNIPNFSITFPESLKTSEYHRYASIVDVSTAISNTLSSKIIDQPNGRRNFLMFRNASATANIYIGFGKEATTLSTLVLAPGGLAAFDTVVQQDDVNAIADAAGAVLCYSYSNIG
jgi:hypothetical protein